MTVYRGTHRIDVLMYAKVICFRLFFGNRSCCRPRCGCRLKKKVCAALLSMFRKFSAFQLCDWLPPSEIIGTKVLSVLKAVIMSSIVLCIEAERKKNSKKAFFATVSDDVTE